jgi:uncharacterized membrane protein
MSNFRDAQNQAHPNKTNTLMLGIIMIMIGILGIQIWLLYSALNNALDDNLGIAIATFIGSLVLFLVGLLVIRYLPDPRGRNGKKPPVGSKYK